MEKLTPMDEDMGGDEEWSNVEGGEGVPETPKDTDSEDGDLTPGRKGLSQGEPSTEATAEATAETTQSKETPPEGETEGEEGREAEKTRAVLSVSQEEKDRHELTHCPFRSWCKYCIMGRAHKKPHRRTAEEDKNPGVDRVSMDYFYMSQRDEEAK